MMGEKAATNEVINQLVNVLEDQSENVRWSASETLGMMGGKAATNEVIGKFLVLMKSDTDLTFGYTVKAVHKILNSSGVIRQLDPKIMAELCFWEGGSLWLENIPAEHLLEIFLTTKNSDWLCVVARVTLVKGVAVTAMEYKALVYVEKESLELVFPNLELRQQLIEALTNQAKELHLFFEMPSEDGDHS
jgi:hypothetical protein